jgi:phosphatidylglycerol---prolipoprotein diacylglyceryl transferase
MIAPDIDPVAIRLGPLAIHWYGLMWVAGIVGGWWVGTLRARRYPSSGWREQEIGDLTFYIALGAVVGGRLGYVLFYNLGAYLQNPLGIFAVWTGGMSFHGGLLGVCVAMWLYARKTQRDFFEVSDFLALLTPVGLATGRLGNFINQELWGKTTDLPWGMVFKTGGPQPRHPSQLYEFALEGIALFAILWLYASKPRPVASLSGLFLVCYGTFRFIVELVREPDAHIGYLAFGWVTMGQVLSIPMILFGVWLMWWAYHRAGRAPATA